MPRRQKPRNFHACHPIMGKGGPHEKSKGAKRAAAKRDTRRKESEWLDRSKPHFIPPITIFPPLLYTSLSLESHGEPLWRFNFEARAKI